MAILTHIDVGHSWGGSGGQKVTTVVFVRGNVEKCGWPLTKYKI